MDYPIRIGHIELGEVLEQQGDAWVISTRRGGILTPVLFWLNDWLSKEKRGDFDPTAFEQQLKKVLDTPDGWRQLKMEWGAHKELLTLLNRLSSDELAALLRQRRCRYQDLLGIDTLNEDIFWRVVAKGGKMVGLPTALKKVLAEEIQDIARARISSKYVDGRGSLPLLIRWGKKGIGRGLKNLDECPDLNVVQFLLRYVGTSIQEGYDSIMNPPRSKGPKDLLQRKKQLIPLDKPLQLDHTLHPQTEDADYKDSYVLTVKDRLGDRSWDEEIQAQIRLEKVLGQLTGEERHTVFEGYFDDVNLKDKAEGDLKKYAAQRKKRSRARRKVIKALRAAEAVLKKPRGGPKKKR